MLYTTAKIIGEVADVIDMEVALAFAIVEEAIGFAWNFSIRHLDDPSILD